MDDHPISSYVWAIALTLVMFLAGEVFFVGHWYRGERIEFGIGPLVMWAIIWFVVQFVVTWTLVSSPRGVLVLTGLQVGLRSMSSFALVMRMGWDTVLGYVVLHGAMCLLMCLGTYAVIRQHQMDEGSRRY